MSIVAAGPAAYIESLPDDRKDAISTLRKTILDNLPKGFAEEISYGMLGYVVPHSIYPAGYHCNPKLSLPFMSLASQKKFIAFYHMGLYAMPELMEWFTSEYKKYTTAKLDIGKSCIRFKKAEDIPYDLIRKLVSKVSVAEWINVYETNFKRK